MPRSAASVCGIAESMAFGLASKPASRRETACSNSIKPLSVVDHFDTVKSRPGAYSITEG